MNFPRLPVPDSFSKIFQIAPVLESHDGSRRIATKPLSDLPDWACSISGQPLTCAGGEAWQGSLVARLGDGRAEAATVGVQFTFADWSEDVYVLMPGAVYAGNRFPTFSTSYPPLLPARSASDPNRLPLLSEVPRLRHEPGPSCLRQMSSDPAFPGIGFYFPKSQTGLWVLTPAVNELGLLGFELQENDLRDTAVLTIFSPGMRREFEYEICCDRVPSRDRARNFVAGDAVTIPLRIEAFPCAGPQGLFDRLIGLRRSMVPAPEVRHSIPFSETWRILEDKYLRENWVEPQGYFSVGVEPMRSRSSSQNWQIGWTGGMLPPLAFVQRGCEAALDRGLRNFDFVFPNGQAPSGYFYAEGDGTVFYGDNAEECPGESRSLVRKNADALFFMLTTLAIAERKGLGGRIQPAWIDGLRKCAEAFVSTWEREGQWGHFVNHDTGAVVVANSASGALVPAALLVAAKRFPERRADYLRIAIESADHFDREFLQKGITVGGPGDAAQCPDSESLAGLLESFVTLFEETGDARWLDAARRAATHAASWTVSYDFPFPPESTFGKLGMLANGTVLANAQNKHSAPGICTHSGLSLLRLFRHTGETWMMDLLRDIAHTLPQFMSRADRPITWKMPYNLPDDPEEKSLRPGWMCERVNLTYWGGHEHPGEVFFYSCWSEISLLLAIAELPGIYARRDTREVWSLDHLDARWNGDSLVISNPTAWPATFTVLVESAAEASATPWHQQQKIFTADLAPGAEVCL